MQLMALLSMDIAQIIARESPEVKRIYKQVKEMLLKFFRIGYFPLALIVFHTITQECFWILSHGASSR